MKSKKANSLQHFNVNKKQLLKCKRSNSRQHFNVNKKQLLKCKRSQVAIFVIIGLVIVVSVALIFTFLRFNIGKAELREDPESYIKLCSEEAILEIEEKILESNGYPNNPNLTNSIIYRGEIVPYLCKASEYYVPCMPQEPLFSNKVLKDIEEYITPRIEKCFEDVVKEFERNGYDVSEKEGEIKVSFESKAIFVDVNKEISIIRGDESRTYSNFRTIVNSPLYNLIDTAEKITNFESTLCTFDHINWMLNNPQIKIEKFSASDQTKVYTLIERSNEKKINIAIKTCMLPAGL